MDIIVHGPKEPERLLELQKRIAAVHAEAAIRKILSISCPKQQKEALLRAIMKGAE